MAENPGSTSSAHFAPLPAVWRRLFTAFALTLAVLALYDAFQPAMLISARDIGVEWRFFDKLAHIGGYGALAACLGLALVRHKPHWLARLVTAALLSTAWAGLCELVQYQNAQGRVGSWLDLAASAGGAFLPGMGCAALLLRMSSWLNARPEGPERSA